MKNDDLPLEKVRLHLLISESFMYTHIYNALQNDKPSNRVNSIMSICLQTHLGELSRIWVSSDGSKNFPYLSSQIQNLNSQLIKYYLPSPKLSEMERIFWLTLFCLQKLPLSDDEQINLQMFIEKCCSASDKKQADADMYIYNIPTDPIRTKQDSDTYFLILNGYIKSYRELLHILDMLIQKERSEIKCFLSNKLTYNQLQIDMLIQCTPVLTKDSEYIKYKKNIQIPSRQQDCHLEQ